MHLGGAGGRVNRAAPWVPAPAIGKPCGRPDAANNSRGGALLHFGERVHNKPREETFNHDATAADGPWLPVPADPGGEHRLPLRFIGSGSEHFRIWIVNLLFTLVTLGLYNPFAKVRRLRYFHGATEVGGHPLSFHADPWKMLRGYLLVMLLFAACGGAGRFSPVAGAVAFCIIAALWPALWHSSLRFRLANTGWRGLRLHSSRACRTW